MFRFPLENRCGISQFTSLWGLVSSLTLVSVSNRCGILHIGQMGKASRTRGREIESEKDMHYGIEINEMKIRKV